MTWPTSIADRRGDGRGIRNGLISRYPSVDVRSHQVWKDDWINERRKREVTRDILEVTVGTGRADAGRYVIFLANHWPSRAGGERRVGWRKQAAAVMSTRVAEIHGLHADRLVISVGDFNDELTDAPFKDVLELRALGAALPQLGVLSFLAPGLECFGKPRNDQATYLWLSGKVWNIQDHVLVAEGPSVLSSEVTSFRYVPGSFRVVRHRFENEDGTLRNCSAFERKLHGDLSRCLWGASDHRPIVATFE